MTCSLGPSVPPVMTEGAGASIHFLSTIFSSVLPLGLSLIPCSNVSSNPEWKAPREHLSQKWSFAGAPGLVLFWCLLVLQWVFRVHCPVSLGLEGPLFFPCEAFAECLPPSSTWLFQDLDLFPCPGRLILPAQLMSCIRALPVLRCLSRIYQPVSDMWTLSHNFQVQISSLLLTILDSETQTQINPCAWPYKLAFSLPTPSSRFQLPYLIPSISWSLPPIMLCFIILKHLFLLDIVRKLCGIVSLSLKKKDIP